MGPKKQVGKPRALKPKSTLTEGLNATASAASSSQLAEPNPQTPPPGDETTFLCFFCSTMKDVKDRYLDRKNTCVQCHAYYMAQVSAR